MLVKAKSEEIVLLLFTLANNLNNRSNNESMANLFATYLHQETLRKHNSLSDTIKTQTI